MTRAEKVKSALKKFFAPNNFERRKVAFPIYMLSTVLNTSALFLYTPLAKKLYTSNLFCVVVFCWLILAPITEIVLLFRPGKDEDDGEAIAFLYPLSAVLLICLVIEATTGSYNGNLYHLAYVFMLVKVIFGILCWIAAVFLGVILAVHMLLSNTSIIFTQTECKNK